MKPLYFKLTVLLLCSQSLFAEPQPSQSVTVNMNNEALNDPTLMTKKLVQGLAGVFLPAEQKPTPPSSDNSAGKGEIRDPTRMNQNFREALKRVSANNAISPGGIITPSSALPEITLVASVCGMHKDKNHAMLRINDKTEMVSIGDKITTVDNNQIIEIHILEITKGHVKVNVLPANETIFLR